MPLFVWGLYGTSLIMQVLGNAGARDHARCCLIARARPSAWGSSIPKLGGDPAAVPALLLVLLAPRRLHHDPAGDGRDLGADRGLQRKRIRFGYRLIAFSSRLPSPLPGLSRLGAPHVHLGPVRRVLAGLNLLVPDADLRRLSPRRSRSSTGWRRCTRDRSQLRDADALRPGRFSFCSRSVG